MTLGCGVMWGSVAWHLPRNWPGGQLAPEIGLISSVDWARFAVTVWMAG